MRYTTVLELIVSPSSGWPLTMRSAQIAMFIVSLSLNMGRPLDWEIQDLS